jgi:hypothetical protein
MIEPLSYFTISFAGTDIVSLGYGVKLNLKSARRKQKTRHKKTLIS